MHRLRSIYMIAIITFLISCVNTTSDIKVSSEFNPKTNFSGFKTYSWLSATEWVIDLTNKWKSPGFEVSKAIKELVDRELEKRDIIQTTTNPDLVVSFFLEIDMAATKLKTDPEMKVKILKDVPQGSLGIALVDVQAGYVIWMAQATAELQDNAPDSLKRERLDYAVTKIFEQLPVGK